MARASENSLTSANRRIAAVSNHLIPATPGCNSQSIALKNTSMDDNYHRIHGEVPSHDVVWKIACDESGKEFIDIIYEKAEGEAIAKVVEISFVDSLC